MLHMVKLAVGVSSLEEMQAVQARYLRDGVFPVHTRMFPKRADELLAGGSLYRVVSGSILCRQRIVSVGEGTREDGSRCAVIGLEAAIVPVLPRAMRPFQGWRYLKPADAPPDLAASPGAVADLPPALRRALMELCLL